MTETAAPIVIKLPKTFQKIMNRWGVKLRSQPITVTHKMYRTETVCSPSVYAVYEVAIKANYVSHMLMLNCTGNYAEMLGCMQHYYGCLTDDDELPFVTDEMAGNAQAVGLAADNDYLTAVRLLVKAGLYYDLLD